MGGVMLNQVWSALVSGSAVKVRWCLTLGLLSSMLTGCSTYRDRTNSFMVPYQQGKYDAAASAVNNVVGPVRNPDGTFATKAKVENEDQLLFRMQQGQVLRSANQLDDSIAALRIADGLIDKQDQQASVRITEEAAVAMTNQRFRDYEAFQYDRLAVQLNLALAYLQKGDVDNARVAMRAMQQRQQEAETYFEKEIEDLESKQGEPTKAKDDAGKQQADVNKTFNDPGLQSQFKQVYGDAPTLADRKAIRKFVNPFGEYLQGVYFLSLALGASDVETGVVAFKRVAGMLPDNPYVKADLAEAERVAAGNLITPTTYVFFETGLAPYRDQIRIDIPLFLLNLAYSGNRVPYVGAAFPVLKYHQAYEQYLSAAAGGATYQTTLMTDMDEVVKTDFNNELPKVIFRTIFSTATKAAASYGINKAAEANTYALIGTMVATTVYQAAMNEADLRTWESLPKQFQVARFPTPEDRKVTLTLTSGAALPTLDLVPGTINVIYVKSTAPGQPPAISQYKIK
jgi:uncharacterized protein